MADKYDLVEEHTADITMLEQLRRDTISKMAEDFRERAMIREIVSEVYTHEDWCINLNAVNLVENEGYPQVHIHCVGRPGDTWIRVRMDGIDYTDEQIKKAEENDAYLEQTGQHYHTISSMAEFYDAMEEEEM